MLGKNNDYMNQQKCGQKFEKYFIKKLKVGAASVLVGAGFFFWYYVEASEVTETTTVVATQNNGTEEKEKSDVTTPTNTVVAETPKAENAQVTEKNAVTEPVTKPAFGAGFLYSNYQSEIRLRI